jgi:hypothetical protein
MLKMDFRARTNFVINSTPEPPPPIIESPFRVDIRQMNEGWGWENNGAASSKEPEDPEAARRSKSAARRERRKKLALVHAAMSTVDVDEE